MFCIKIGNECINNCVLLLANIEIIQTTAVIIGKKSSLYLVFYFLCNIRMT